MSRAHHVRMCTCTQSHDFRIPLDRGLYTEFGTLPVRDGERESCKYLIQKVTEYIAMSTYGEFKTSRKTYIIPLCIWLYFFN